MRFLDRLERKFGFLAFPGIIRIVVAFQALVFLLMVFRPGFVELLTFDKAAVLSGQFWRVITFVFIPPTPGMLGALGVAIALYVLWLLGDGLEQAWGSFKLNLFFLVGLLGAGVMAMVAGGADSGPLLASIFFAFATLYPDFEFLLFFILPVKVKWLAWIAFVLLMVGFLGAPFPMKGLLLVSFANYLLFFGPTLWRNFRDRRQIAQRRAEYDAKSIPESETLHQCKVCGKTEATDPHMDFRVAADGEEYCSEHLPRPESGSESRL